MKHLFLFTCLALSITLSSQTISSYVITTAGESIMSEDGALYLSIGEPMNTELENGGIMISQGFLNVSINGRIVNTEELLVEKISLFPNPTVAQINLELEGNTEDYSFQIYSAGGQIVNPKTSILNASIDVSHYENGNYYLTIHKDGKSSQTLQFIKL